MQVITWKHCVRHMIFSYSILGPHLEIVVLALLLGLEVQASKSAQVLSADSLVYGCPSPDALSVVVRNIRPPVSLLLDVAQDHVLDGGWQPRNLPRDVRLPAEM